MGAFETLLGVLQDTLAIGRAASSRVLLKRESAAALGARNATDAAYVNVRALAAAAANDCMILDQMVETITFIIDGGGAVITTGVKGDLQIDGACTIQSVTMLADQTGSIVVDIWAEDYANYPPTVADTITASAKPTITAATKSTDATLTGWTTAIAAGDILRYNVDSVTDIQRVTVVLKVKRTA